MPRGSGEGRPRVSPAPIVVIGCFGAGWLAHRLRPIRFLPDLGAGQWVAGAAIVLLALAVGLSGVREFHRRGTPTSPFERSTALVTSGVFRFTRNPMYLGFVLLAIGVAVALDAAAFRVAAVVLAALLEVLVIRPEERSLAEQFGAAFEDYRRRTRRWI